MKVHKVSRTFNPPMSMRYPCCYNGCSGVATLHFRWDEVYIYCDDCLLNSPWFDLDKIEKAFGWYYDEDSSFRDIIILYENPL